MKQQLMIPVRDIHQAYLRDESSAEGTADTISFPESAADVQTVLTGLVKNQCGDAGTEAPADHGMMQQDAPALPLTVRGAGTGVRGEAVPHGGHLMCLSKCSRIRSLKELPDGTAEAVVEPGVTLEELRLAVQRAFRKSAYFWPPSPTEQSASIGGIAATGACGMNVCCYGETVHYIKAMSVVFPDGSVCHYRKHAANPAEWPAVWISSRERSGVITELTLELVRKPAERWGIACFFSEEAQALDCADALQEAASAWNGDPSGGGKRPEQTGGAGANAQISALEFFSRETLQMIAQARERMEAIRSIPDYPDGADTMIYLEAAGSEEDVEACIMELMEICAAYGADPDQTWAFCGEIEIEKMHAFRHAAAETVVEETAGLHAADPRIYRLLASPETRGLPFGGTWRALRETIRNAGIRSSMYAHIRQTAIEVNLLPENADQFYKGKQLIEELES